LKKFVFVILMLLSLLIHADTPQTIYNYFSETEYKEVAEEITALAVLETGWFKSQMHNQFYNYFSIKEFNKKKKHPLCKKFPIYCMRQYDSTEEGLDDILRYFRKKKYPTHRKEFLERLDGKTGVKYAEDPKHVKKVKIIVKMLYKKGILKKWDELWACF